MSSCEQADESSPSSSTSPGKLRNRNIKERLNLHVKRRLQETALDTSSTGLSTTTVSSSVPARRGAPSERITSTHSGRGGGAKKSKGTKHSLTAATTPTTATASLSFPDDECSRDESSSCNDANREKDHSPDILTMVLNNKKLSLLEDPEVKKFLEKIVGIIGK